MSDETVPLRSQAEPFSKRNAQSAFERRDIDASRREHGKSRFAHTEAHLDMGDYLKAMVFGGMDGILTTFCLISSAVGTAEGHGMSPTVLIMLAIANLVADGFSMGCGEAMSNLAEHDYALKERSREQWEVDNNLEGEIDEMVDIYTQKGMPEEDARQAMTIFARSPEVFVDLMMKVELGITVATDEEVGLEPFKKGFAMFAAFCIFGFVPVLAFVPAAVRDAALHRPAIVEPVSSAASLLAGNSAIGLQSLRAQHTLRAHLAASRGSAAEVPSHLHHLGHADPVGAPVGHDDSLSYSTIEGAPYYVSIGLTAIALFVLGCLKGKVGQRPILRSAVQLTVTGLFAAAISYVLGVVLARLLAP